MELVFFDTSAIVALFNKKDKNHKKAKKMMGTVKSGNIRLVMTDDIFNETITIALSRVNHSMACRIGEFLLESKIVEIVWLDKAMRLRAWEYFKKYADKEYSFTDCSSFVFMKERGIRKFFAFDKHFIRAGFLSML